MTIFFLLHFLRSWRKQETKEEKIGSKGGGSGRKREAGERGERSLRGKEGFLLLFEASHVMMRMKAYLVPLSFFLSQLISRDHRFEVNRCAVFLFVAGIRSTDY